MNVEAPMNPVSSTTVRQQIRHSREGFRLSQLARDLPVTLHSGHGAS